MERHEETLLVDEYHTTIEGDMEVTISWVERDDK